MFIEIKPSINTFTVYTFFSTNPRINLLNDSLFSAKNIAPVFLININAVITLYFGKINQPNHDLHDCHYILFNIPLSANIENSFALIFNSNDMEEYLRIKRIIDDKVFT